MSLWREPKKCSTAEAENENVEEIHHAFKVRDTKANVFENDKEFVIQVELPGAVPDSIKVETKFNDNMICVSANVICPDSANKFHLKERVCGTFSRTFSLNGINGSDKKVSFSQTYVNGVLEIKVVKA